MGVWGCGSAERTNKHAGERQLDKHKCESADCEGFLFRMMMSCVWEEEVKDNSIAHPSHTCLQYSYGLLPPTLSLSLALFRFFRLPPLHMQLPARLFVFVLGKQWNREAGYVVRVVVQARVPASCAGRCLLLFLCCFLSGNFH